MNETKDPAKDSDLFPIYEEELQIEEACENELEQSRRTLQNIRYSSKLANGIPNSPNADYGQTEGQIIGNESEPADATEH